MSLIAPRPLRYSVVAVQPDISSVNCLNCFRHYDLTDKYISFCWIKCYNKPYCEIAEDVDLASLREFVAAFLLQLFKRSLYLHHRVPEGCCVSAQLESMIRFFS